MFPGHFHTVGLSIEIESDDVSFTVTNSENKCNV